MKAEENARQKGQVGQVCHSRNKDMKRMKTLKGKIVLKQLPRNVLMRRFSWVFRSNFTHCLGVLHCRLVIQVYFCSNEHLHYVSFGRMKKQTINQYNAKTSSIVYLHLQFTKSFNIFRFCLLYIYIILILKNMIIVWKLFTKCRVEKVKHKKDKKIYSFKSVTLFFCLVKAFTIQRRIQRFIKHLRWIVLLKQLKIKFCQLIS